MMHNCRDTTTTAAKINLLDYARRDLQVEFLKTTGRSRSNELRVAKILFSVKIELNFPGARIRAPPQVRLETVSNWRFLLLLRLSSGSVRRGFAPFPIGPRSNIQVAKS